MTNPIRRFRHHHRGLHALFVGAVAVATALVVATPASAASAASAADGSPRGDISYSNSVPAWATPAADAGPTPADTTVEGELYLTLRDASGARALAAAVSDPSSRDYGRYTSARQWIRRFSPTRKAFRAAENYLRKSGFTIYATPASREYIVFRGPAAAAGPAFGTTLHNYRLAGGLRYAPSSAPTLPRSIGVDVLGLSVDSGRAMTRPTDVTPVGSEPTSSPKTGHALAPQALSALPKYTCSDYYGQHTGVTPEAYGSTSFPTFLCGYLPDQLRSGYNLNKLITSGNDGTGQTIAIIDAYASPTILRDTNDYMLAVGSPLLTKFREITPKAFVDAEACGYASGWQGEETLDVESAHSIAPGAGILYVGGFNCGGGLDIAMSEVLDRHLANIVSNSYGNQGENLPLSSLLGEQNLQMQAAAEGIGLYFSSGDAGDESLPEPDGAGYATPDFPASSPWVTAVGGTSEAFGASGAREFSTGWGTILNQVVLNGGSLSFAAPLPGNLWGGGAGGGTSTQFAEPDYQKGVVPAALASASPGGPGRVVPDVAALADPYTGLQIALRPIKPGSCTGPGRCTVGPLVYQTYGGTSLASPITAAEMSLLQQASGRRPAIGFANPALYASYRVRPRLFNDVTTPNPPTAVAYTSAKSGNDYFVNLDRDLSLTTAPGYDDVTGLGELNVPAMAAMMSRGRR